MLTKEAFNALLKTLEEPPAHVKFMFATTEPEKVLPTILSRCQRFDLRRIPVGAHRQAPRRTSRNRRRCKIDRRGAPRHRPRRRRRHARRRIHARSTDQLLRRQDRGSRRALHVRPRPRRARFLALAAPFSTARSNTALRELNDLAKHGKDLGRLLADLLEPFPQPADFSGFARRHGICSKFPKPKPRRSSEQSALVDAEALTRIMEVLTDAEGRLRDAASKKIFVEVALLKAIEARNADQHRHRVETTSGDSCAEDVFDVRSAPRPASRNVRAGPDASADPDL